MTDFSSYFLTIFLTKKNLQYYQKSEIFDFKQNNKSVSFKNKNLLISRSTLTGVLIQKLIRNPHCFQHPKTNQKQCMQVMSRWNKLEIPRPLPIKFGSNNEKYTSITNHCNQPFFATGYYDGCIKLWKLSNFQYKDCGKILLKSKFLTINNIVFHNSLPYVFASDSKGNSKMWHYGSKVKELWTPSREITEIIGVAMHPTMPIVVIADKKDTTVYILNEYGNEIGYIFLQDGCVSCMTFSKTGKHLVIGNSRGEIKLFLFEQDIDNSWIIYQTDSCQYTSKISNIVMTDEIIVFAGDEEENMHMLRINDNSILSKSQILKVNGCILGMKISDCESFIYARIYEFDFLYSNDSDDSDDSDFSFSIKNFKMPTFKSNHSEDILEPTKISVFLLNRFNQVVPIGETMITKTYLSFGLNGELICA
jgi:WD40 repeat protein